MEIILIILNIIIVIANSKILVLIKKAVTSEMGSPRKARYVSVAGS